MVVNGSSVTAVWAAFKTKLMPAGRQDFLSTSRAAKPQIRVSLLLCKWIEVVVVSFVESGRPNTMWEEMRKEMRKIGKRAI